MSEDNNLKDGVGELEPETRGEKGERAMSKKATTKQPWDVEIDIHLKKGCPDPQFEIYTTLPVSNGAIEFRNNHRPGFNITFTLYDESGENYLFPPQSKVREACWSLRGNTCPTSAAYDVFDPRTVDHSRTTLVVFNDNPDADHGGPLGEFMYTLRVTKDECASYCCLDPGGNDMNGPRI